MWYANINPVKRSKVSKKSNYDTVSQKVLRLDSELNMFQRVFNS